MSALELRYMIPLEKADLVPTNDGNTKAIFIQPAMNLSIPFKPTQISFQVGIGIANLEKRQYNFRIEFITPSGEVISKQGGPIVIDVDPNSDEPAYINIISEFRNVTIKEEGAYSLKLYFDEEEIGTQALDIRVKE